MEGNLSMLDGFAGSIRPCLLYAWQATDDWRDVRRRFTNQAAFRDLAEAQRRNIIRAFLAGIQVLCRCRCCCCCCCSTPSLPLLAAGLC